MVLPGILKEITEHPNRKKKQSCGSATIFSHMKSVMTGNPFNNLHYCYMTGQNPLS